MDILLIEPPATSDKGNLRTLGSMGTLKSDMGWPPLDLMIISGLLEKHNISSLIYDANTLRASFDNVKELIKREKPRLVVFTTSTPTIYHDLEVAKVAKEVSHDILTAAVGTHIMALPEETMKESKSLDIAIYSESELVILDIAKSWYNPSNVNGIIYRDGDELKKRPPHKLCSNLDEFGFPSHHKLDLKIYRDPLMKRFPMTITYGQRGCINACTYCSSPFYSNLRHRSIEHVVEELRLIVGLGIKEVRFFDCGLTNNLNWANNLMDHMISEEIDLTWICNVRADRLNPEILKKMKRAGCHSVSLGGESADQTILQNVEKNLTPEDIKEAVREVKNADIKPMVYFMLGLPGETADTMRKTIKFAMGLGPEIITLGIATPHPGTKFYEYMENHGYLSTKDWSKYDPVKKPVYKYPDLSSKEILEAVNKGYRTFYLRPSYILKRASGIRSLLDIKNNYKNFIGFIERYVFHSE